MLDQFRHASSDSRVRLLHGGAEHGIFRGRITVHGPPVTKFSVEWSGESALTLPHGVLDFAPACGEGIAAAALRSTKVTVRQRVGGERMRLAADRGSRPVKRLLHDAGIAPWQRASLPFVYCGDVLAAVAEIGVDAAFRASGDAPGIALRWHPGARSL